MATRLRGKDNGHAACPPSHELQLELEAGTQVPHCIYSLSRPPPYVAFVIRVRAQHETRMSCSSYKCRSAGPCPRRVHGEAPGIAEEVQDSVSFLHMSR